MPVYEYECGKCGVRFEELQKMSDPPLKTHNGCAGRVERVLSAPGIQFKGSGWYVTDYARRGSSSDGKDGKRAAGESKAEAKSETKNGSDKPKAESKASEKSTKS